MSDAEVLLTIAGAVITVWISLLVAGLIWFGRRTISRARHECRIVFRAARLRTRRALVDGLGAFLTLCWIVVAVALATPLLLTVAPLLLAIAGLDLTAHVVKIGH